MSGAQLKYVRHGSVGFVVWPAQRVGMTHEEVARATFMSQDVRMQRIISAGFVEWDADGRPLCMGKSDTLGIASREDDTDALRAEWGMVCRTCSGRGVIGGFQNSAAPGYVTEDCPDCSPRAPLPPSLQAEAQAIGAGGDAESLEVGD